MFKCLTCLAVVGALLTFSAPARADDAAVAANQLLGAQIADAITTRIDLRQPGAYETQSITRPFVKSDLGALGFFIGQNLIQRVLFRHAPTVIRLFTLGEVYYVGHNIQQLNKR